MHDPDNQFLQPRLLNALMVDPELNVVVAWCEAIGRYLDRLRQNEAECQAFDLGDQFRTLVHKAIAYRQMHYCIYCVLVYLQCTPPAQIHLHEKEHRYLREFSADLGRMLTGHTEDGQSYGTRCDSTHAHTISFIARQLERYGYRWHH